LNVHKKNFAGKVGYKKGGGGKSERRRVSACPDECNGKKGKRKNKFKRGYLSVLKEKGKSGWRRTILHKKSESKRKEKHFSKGPKRKKRR